jgi:hypothetical protein
MEVTDMDLRQYNNNVTDFLRRVKNVSFDNIQSWDYPDFSDAYIAEAEIEDLDGTYRDATEKELDLINEHLEWFGDELYAQAM